MQKMNMTALSFGYIKGAVSIDNLWIEYCNALRANKTTNKQTQQFNATIIIWQSVLMYPDIPVSNATNKPSNFPNARGQSHTLFLVKAHLVLLFKPAEARFWYKREKSNSFVWTYEVWPVLRCFEVTTKEGLVSSCFCLTLWWRQAWMKC